MKLSLVCIIYRLKKSKIKEKESYINAKGYDLFCKIKKLQ